MKNYILAHDLGTSGNKVTLYDAQGLLRASAFCSYTTDYPATNWAEQDAEDWWRAVCVSTQQLLQEAGIAPGEVACIVFSGQMMSCVPLGRDARPLRKAIIWADQRAVEQVARLGRTVSTATVYRITGHRLGASYSLAKMLWLRDHQPELYRATYKFVHAKDAMVARLTGSFVTDYSDASGMNLLDLEKGTWSEQILQAAAVDAGQLPEVRLSTALAGRVLPAVATDVGLLSGTPVVVGGGDGACAAAGAGVVRPGPAYTYLGSSAWIAMAGSKPVYDPDFKTFTFAHVVPGLYMPIGTMQTAGTAYQWARDHLCAGEVAAAGKLGENVYELMNREAARAPVGANGLIFLPYLLGERSPRWNPDARGAFIGLTVRHTRADMLRALLEGVSLNLRVILDALRGQGAAIDTMRLIGGGARGHFWNQILADVYGLPIQRLAVLEEATSMGAALVGGVGIGLYPDFSFSERMNRTVAVVEPGPEAQAVYERMYPVFEAAYSALLPVYRMLAQL